MAYRKENYRQVKQIIRGTATGTAANVSNVAGLDVDVVCLTGNLWVNPLTTAAQATGIPIEPGSGFSVCVPAGGALSVISDTTATYMVLVLGE